MARTAFAALAFGMLGAANALEMVSPMSGEEVAAGSAYTVEWTGTTDGRFDVDLYYCGSMCMDGECGEWVTALCPYGDEGCPDTKGDYDIMMPEPMDGTASGYKVMVTDASDESDMGCSDAFTLVAADDVPDALEAGAYVMVTSPSDGDTAMAGGEYTVEFDYDDGSGGTTNRFAIDLYSVGGSGDCGTYITSVCDKESIGCKDSQGDYDVIIPSGTESGMYSIRVGVFENEAVYGCSDSFEVVGSDSSMSMSMRF
ncbi:unnamed protein product [Ectocarpus fasciculatus]